MTSLLQVLGVVDMGLCWVNVSRAAVGARAWRGT